MKDAIIAAMALAFAGCTNMATLPGSPAALADQTKLDEQAGLGVELAYQGAALAVTTAARAGLIPADQRPRVSNALQDAYDAVLRVRDAYDVGSAATYQPALIEARRLVANVLTPVREECTMFDLTTIMKAIQLVGVATPAGKVIYDGFVFLLSGATQDEFKARYAAERERSDEAHEAAQQALSGEGAGSVLWPSSSHLRAALPPAG